jgi:tyrosine-protein kinase Etk/Wzc
MSEEKGLDFLDFLIVIAKWKKLIFFLALFTLVTTYTVVYYYVPEQFEANVLIIPSEQDQMSSFSSLLKGVSSLPIGLGSASKNKNADFFNTIIYSRTNLDSVIVKFGLMNNYKVHSREACEKILKANIKTVLTEENAYSITVRADTRQKSADIANYIVDLLNESVIDMNATKSKENRQFLEIRYNEIKDNLRKAEDSLKRFQESSGMFEAEGQLKSIIETNANLEATLANKQIELTVYEKMLGKDAPQIQQIKMTVDEYKKKLEKLKSNGEGVMLPLNSIPIKTLSYFRLYRDVKVLNSMLEFIIPMYEQAKFEEKKDIPILQVVDRAVPPEKRAAPQRALISLIVTFAVLVFTIIMIILRELLHNTKNQKLLYIIDELKIFKSKKQKIDRV